MRFCGSVFFPGYNTFFWGGGFAGKPKIQRVPLKVTGVPFRGPVHWGGGPRISPPGSFVCGVNIEAWSPFWSDLHSTGYSTMFTGVIKEASSQLDFRWLKGNLPATLNGMRLAGGKAKTEVRGPSGHHQDDGPHMAVPAHPQRGKRGAWKGLEREVTFRTSNLPGAG